jgi:PAS domain S-box-containing protein
VTEPMPARLDQHISHFFELSSEAMVVADGRGRLERVNGAFQRILGYAETEDELSYLELVHPDDFGGARAALESAATDQSTRSEVRVKRADGSFILMLWMLNRVAQDDVLLGIGIDITELKDAEAEERTLFDADLRRRQALQVNDDLTQGLVVAKYALEEGEIDKAKEAVYATLRASQAIADRLIEHSGEQVALKPGDLVKGGPAHIEEGSS